MTTNNQTNINNSIIQITEYSIDSFVFKIQEYIKQGYKISDRIEGYPIQAGVAFYCIMLKDEEVKDNQPAQEVKQSRSKKS